MPWGVAKRDACPVSAPWAVYREADAGRPEKIWKCHTTRDQALAHQRALYANTPEGQSRSAGMRETLTARAEWKAGGNGTGELEGYASVFGNVDQGGDVVVPGAFRKTLADWKSSGQPLPLIADHDLTTEGLIGSVADAREDPVGLWVRARFSGTAKAQDIRQKMIEGHLRGMSFTYEALKHHMGTVAGKSVRYLQELRLFEATVTPFPMNTLAAAAAKADHGNIDTANAADLDAAARRYAASQGWAMPDGSYPIRPANLHGADDLARAIRAVGRGSGSHDAIRRHIMARARAIGMSDQIPDTWMASGMMQGSASLDFTAWRDSMRSALDIAFEPAAKAAAGILLAAGYLADENDAAGTPDGEPTADAAAPEGTAENKDAAASYAVAIRDSAGPRDGAPEGEPPDALAYSRQVQTAVESAATTAELDALQAQINDALGRT